MEEEVPVPRNNSSTGGTLEGETMEPMNCRGKLQGGAIGRHAVFQRQEPNFRVSTYSDEPSSISIIDTHQFQCVLYGGTCNRGYC